MRGDLGSKKFKFNKIAYYGKRKVNTPEVEMELTDTDKGPELSICGLIWNASHTDCVCCGQCLDEMNRFESLKHNALFAKLYRLWKLYHLNGLHAGSEKQEDALLKWEDSFTPNDSRSNDYVSRCDYLKSIGLYVDDGYTYGSKWLYREIPEDDLKLIKELLTFDNE